MKAQLLVLLELVPRRETERSNEETEYEERDCDSDPVQDRHAQSLAINQP